MFFLVGYFCCFNRGLGVRFCYFFLKWGGDCGKWIKYIQKVVIGNIWIPGKFLVFLPLGLAKQSRTILGHSTLEEPSFTLGLYQARPPSAASRHLSLAVGYLWGLKYVFFSQILRLIAQSLSRCLHTCCQLHIIWAVKLCDISHQICEKKHILAAIKSQSPNIDGG